MAHSKRPVYQKIDDLVICKVFQPEVVREALSYQPENDDLFIVSFPKSGTTWTQQIIYLILEEGKPPMNYAELMLKSPFLEFVGTAAIKSIPGLGTIKTHLAFDLQPYSPKAKYVYVARNPMDCCVSFYHHSKNFPGYEFTDGSFDDFFEVFVNGETEWGDYFDHVLSWYEHLNDPNVLFLTYEDIKKDTRAAVLKIARFIGDQYGQLLERDEDMLQKIIKYSSFDHMKDEINDSMKTWFDDIKQLSPDYLPKFLKDVAETSNSGIGDPIKGDFIRKGNVGDWRSYFSEDQLRRMNNRIAEKTKGSDIMNLWSDLENV